MAEWFRSWHGAPTDIKWRGIARRANVSPAIVVAIAWALMDRASQASPRGCIDGHDAEGLADFFGIETEQVEDVIQAMIDKGVLKERTQPNAGERTEQNAERNIVFASWQRRQPNREDGSAERARAWRENRKNNELAEFDDDVNATERKRTKPNARTEQNRTEQNKKKTPSESKKTRHPIPENWKLDTNGRTYAAERNFSHDEIADMAENFVSYWLDKSDGKDGAKLDWNRAWQTWVRNEAKFARSRQKPAETSTEYLAPWQDPPQAKPAAPHERKRQPDETWAPWQD